LLVVTLQVAEKAKFSLQWST